MINDNIAVILDKIRQLEQQLEDELNSRQTALSYQLRNGRVRFENTVRKLHQQYKTGLLEFLGTAKSVHIATAPVIYSLIVPLALLDFAISLYQHICFRAYGIPLVPRGDYIVIDRHHLAYLNIIEKINCVYCGYGNGVLAFAREISARTEQYWCPIKHASRVLGPHSRFKRFVDYADAENYRQRLAELRKDYDDSGV